MVAVMVVGNCRRRQHIPQIHAYTLGTTKRETRVRHSAIPVYYFFSCSCHMTDGTTVVCMHGANLERKSPARRQSGCPTLYIYVRIRAYEVIHHG